MSVPHNCRQQHCAQEAERRRGWSNNNTESTSACTYVEQEMEQREDGRQWDDRSSCVETGRQVEYLYIK